MKSRRTTLLDDSAFSSRPLTELPLWEVEPQSVASGGSPEGAAKATASQKESESAPLKSAVPDSEKSSAPLVEKKGEGAA